MGQARPTLWAVILKTTVTHTLTYFIMGLLASTLLNYASLYANTSLNLLMRPINEPIVMAGPLFQPIRGVLFGGVFYLLREVVFEKKRGWLVLWIVLLVIGIIGTFGPTPGSLEGMIYTILPLSVQLTGLPEVVLQALILSAVLFYWVNHPENKWLNWVMGIAFFVVLLLPTLGLLAGRPSTTTLPGASITISPTSDMPSGIGDGEGWIEVDLAQQKARIRQGQRIVAEYLAAAGVGDRPETTTYTGLFRVQYKEKGPVESVPGVYVTDVVMFDYSHGNAFHSRPVDKEALVLDERLGLPITAGCVRVGESAALFDFAKLGMKVWVH